MATIILEFGEHLMYTYTESCTKPCVYVHVLMVFTCTELSNSYDSTVLHVQHRCIHGTYFVSLSYMLNRTHVHNNVACPS